MKRTPLFEFEVPIYRKHVVGIPEAISDAHKQAR